MIALNSKAGYTLLRIAEQQYGRAPSALNADELKAVERIAVRQAEIERIVLSSEMAQSVVVPNSEVENAFKLIRNRYESDEEFQHSMEANGFDEKQLRQSLLQELRVESVMDRVALQAPNVEETEARLFYYLHPEQFQQPEMRSARHILITINAEFVENNREVSLAQIQRVAEKVKDGDVEKFIQQAKKISECPTALQGGSLGKVPQSTLFPELDKVLFAMKEGDVSDVVESPMGFHLLLCEKIVPKRQISLAEVLPKLKQKLEDRERERYKKSWLKNLILEVQRNG